MRHSSCLTAGIRPPPDPGFQGATTMNATFPGKVSILRLLGLVMAFLACLPASLVAATVPAGFTDSTIATGLSSPTAMEIAPDGRIFVAQQGGALRIIKNGVLLATPFLTVSVNSSGERGLLGIAFDPDFGNNRYLYLYYTTSGSPIHNRVSRFRASAANP